MEEPYFTRRKEVRIVKLADDRYRLEGELRDDFHLIRASLVIDYPAMTVLEARGEMLQGTNPPFCAGAARVIDGLVGQRIGRGFAKVAAETVGSREGCPHLMEVVTDLGRAAFQIHMCHLRDAALADPELTRRLGHPLEKRQLALTAMPPLGDTCWVFNRDNDARFEREWRERGML